MRICIVGDDALYASVLADRLTERAEVEQAVVHLTVGGEAPHGVAGYDVAVVFWTMPGVVATIELLHGEVGIPVIAIGVDAGCIDAVVACAQSGVSGFLPKTANLDQLAETLQSALRKEFECSPATSAALLRHIGMLAAQRSTGAPNTGLTPRELEVLEYVAADYSNRQISKALFISLQTVKNHVKNILGKLGVSRRGSAAAAAAESFGWRPTLDLESGLRAEDVEREAV